MLPVAALVLSSPFSPAGVIHWKGYAWQVRQAGGGPGPNTWDPANVFVDANGYLHLRIAQAGTGWTCAEVDGPALGYGTYQWQVEGPIDVLDRNVVLGLFGYKGPDGNKEIDVEFARWGKPANPNGNWTVYPNSGSTVGNFDFPFTLTGTYTTSRYTWGPTGIKYWLMGGHQAIAELVNVMQSWDYAPKNPKVLIPQVALPTCMNLWLFQGKAPTNGQPVEIIVHDFEYKP